MYMCIYTNIYINIHILVALGSCAISGLVGTRFEAFLTIRLKLCWILDQREHDSAWLRRYQRLLRKTHQTPQYRSLPPPRHRSKGPLHVACRDRLLSHRYLDPKGKDPKAYLKKSSHGPHKSELLVTIVYGSKPFRKSPCGFPQDDLYPKQGCFLGG